MLRTSSLDFKARKCSAHGSTSGVYSVPEPYELRPMLCEKLYGDNLEYMK